MYSKVIELFPINCNVSYKHNEYKVIGHNADLNTVFLESYGWVRACHITRLKHYNEYIDISRFLHNWNTRNSTTTINEWGLSERAA